ncbi:disabled -like protein [Brachionus plicatilis]|uniref:Disabled-like protein n=1 Tax=Brachionus plicatilis TaxID=10195 RepID=A0A3M7R9Z8_BRAPC|nr:disabled -like protein [Brachionus plicatilis]
MSTPGENETPILSNDNANESEPKKPKPAKKLSVSNDPERFKHGVLVRGKFIGVEDVKKENGDDVCQTAMIKLKAVVLAKKEHKQRICVKINLEGLEILDEKTNQLIFKHSVNSISYIARDTTDPRAIGYIYKNSPNNFQYFAIKTERQAQELFNNLKDLFEVVLMMRIAEKKKNEEKTIEPKEAEISPDEKNPEPLKENELKAQSESTAPETKAPETKAPSSDNLLDFPSNNFHDSWQENSDALFSQSEPSKQPSAELFDVFDNSVQNQTSANDDASSKNNNENSQNDKYNSLLNELSNLSTSPEQRNPLVSYTQPLNSPLSHNGAQNLSPYQQPPQFSIPYQNPFGTFNMYPNQAQMVNRPPPEIPNQAKLNIPQTFNPNATNSNNQNNLFPW